MTVPPGRLDEVGRTLAGHPMVHGTLATTGTTTLMAAIGAGTSPTSTAS